MNKVKGTCKELAEKWGLEYLLVTNFLKFLHCAGHAQIVAQVLPAGGKGRSANVYEFDNVMHLDMLDIKKK